MMEIYYDSDVISIAKEGDNFYGSPRTKRGTKKSSPSDAHSVTDWLNTVNKVNDKDAGSNGKPKQESVKKVMVNLTDSAAIWHR